MAGSDEYLISVVTPSYNQAPFLEETIQSVLSQEYENLEYFVVDGASTDGSLEIIKRYQDQLAWWVSEPDKGQADGINKGLKRSKGDIVCWVNSDDLLMPGALQAVVSAFENNPDALMVYGDVYSIDEQGKVFNSTGYGNWGLQDLMEFSIIGQPAVFVRGKLLRALGCLDETFHYLMDHHLWLRVAQEGEIVHLPQHLAKARYHPQAKNIAKAEHFGEEAFRLVGWMRSQPLIGKRMNAKGVGPRVEAGAHRFNGRYLLDAGKYRESFREYCRSFGYSAPVALREWHRWLYSLLGWMGFGWLNKVFYRLKYGKSA